MLLSWGTLCTAFNPPLSSKHTTFSRKAIVLRDASDSSQGQETQYFSPNAELKEIDIRDPSASNSDGVDTDAMSEYSFFDEATIFIRAGSGGQGASTYKKGPGGQNGQPHGGDGGKGGDVILVADDSLNTLAGLTRAWRPNAFGGGGAATTSISFLCATEQISQLNALCALNAKYNVVNKFQKILFFSHSLETDVFQHHRIL